MIFNSIQYLLFFPVVVLFYFLIPESVRYLWLLAASYFFYMCWNVKYALLILFSTIVTYFCGMLLEKIKEMQWESRKIRLCMKGCVAGSFILNLIVLFWFKYFDFVARNINIVMNLLHIEFNMSRHDVLLPVGISFYTFQVLGYTMDIYRNEIHAEKNLFRYALFVSFFPQLVAGPIERSKNLLVQLRVPTRFHVKKAEWGLLTMAYGLFLKIVVADNIAILIDPVFLDLAGHGTMEIFVATVLFAFQIYCDFQGYTQLAIGSASVLGITIHENFDTPYLARSVKDFWRRWHISLTSWFTDYLYIPLGGNRRGKTCKQINTMVVFLCSGLWHGAGWHYVIWGGINGALSILEDLGKDVLRKIISVFKIDEGKITWKCFQVLGTFLIIDFTWLFFRVDSVTQGIQVLKRLISEFQLKWFLTLEFPGTFDDSNRFFIVMVSLLMLFMIDLLKYRGIDIRTVVFNQQIVFRWLIYWIIFIIIIYWGAYGTGYEQKQFIYFQF